MTEDGRSAAGALTENSVEHVPFALCGRRAVTDSDVFITFSFILKFGKQGTVPEP